MGSRRVVSRWWRKGKNPLSRATAARKPAARRSSSCPSINGKGRTGGGVSGQDKCTSNRPRSTPADHSLFALAGLPACAFRVLHLHGIIVIGLGVTFSGHGRGGQQRFGGPSRIPSSPVQRCFSWGTIRFLVKPQCFRRSPCRSSRNPISMNRRHRNHPARRSGSAGAGDCIDCRSIISGKQLARPKGFEPLTPRFVVCSRAIS